jgi:hypothetical protein
MPDRPIFNPTKQSRFSGRPILRFRGGIYRHSRWNAGRSRVLLQDAPRLPAPESVLVNTAQSIVRLARVAGSRTRAAGMSTRSQLPRVAASRPSAPSSSAVFRSRRLDPSRKADCFNYGDAGTPKTEARRVHVIREERQATWLNGLQQSRHGQTRGVGLRPRRWHVVAGRRPRRPASRRHGEAAVSLDWVRSPPRCRPH